MKSVIGCSIVCFLFFTHMANGQASKVSDERRKEILDYQLTMARANQLIAALGEMVTLLPPDFQEHVRQGNRIGDKEQIERDPKAMDILKGTS
jgi:hypothetical protein